MKKDIHSSKQIILMNEEKYLQSAVFLRLDGKIRLVVCIPIALCSSFIGALCWLHKFGSYIILELSDCLSSEVLKIEFILNFVVAFFFHNLNNSLHMFSRQLSNVNA